MLVFKNDGILDVNGALTFGVSAKKGNNPIGMFGTGLKYASAILLRNDIPFTIYTGGETYRFSKKTLNFRDKEFDTVCVNDRELAYTTHLGIKWDLWQAYRELLCNAMDEGEYKVFTVDTDYEKEYNATYVEVDGLYDVHANADNWFLFGKTPASKSYHCELYTDAVPGLYYKGVRVTPKNDGMVYKYAYNVTSGILELTEDRTVNGVYIYQSYVSDMLSRMTNMDIIRNILTKEKTREDGKSYFESYLGISSEIVSDEFKQVAKKLVKDDKCWRYLKQWVQRYRFTDFYDTYKPSEMQQKQLSESIDFLKRGMNINLEYPILMCDDLGQGVQAIADLSAMRILVSSDCIRMGKKYLTSTLYEEWVHLEKGLKDLTRELQTYLFDQVITAAEDRLGEYL